jgi:hypothetical protein
VLLIDVCDWPAGVVGGSRDASQKTRLATTSSYGRWHWCLQNLSKVRAIGWHSRSPDGLDAMNLAYYQTGGESPVVLDEPTRPNFDFGIFGKRRGR